ncbi:MAG: GTP-binding protein [Chiayiivirga sp.]|nr:GTP-binding protein [Chiayiivirga sp.]MCI1711924.1 GTP-binding protein [Chiayiivirga sp.]MCI1729484.1 GTP-binding protein [Chiayiivirga sp.]
MPETAGAEAPDTHLDRAADSLRALLADDSIPRDLRDALAADYAEVEAMLDRLEHGQVHLAVFGRVSVGKSALLNALLGETRFEVGVLHGTTTRPGRGEWREARTQGVHLIDTPGINELSGEEREKLAFEVAGRSDVVLFVVDGDMTSIETEALRVLASTQRPILLALNKADRYTPAQREELRARLIEHARGSVRAENLVEVMALPAPERVLQVQADGSEREIVRERGPDVTALRARLLALLEAEGKTLAALNAVLFAGRLSDEVGHRLTALRRDLAERVTRTYCLAKGVAVALNPVPVADLLAAAALDVALVTHLSRIYGLPMTRSEAGKLLATIAAQLAALMGAIWGVHLVASALKGASAGLSTLVTAGAQGALAWYATTLVARAAERYLAAGKSWGEQGPKRVVQEIVDSLDRDSILREARAEILARLKR